MSNICVSSNTRSFISAVVEMNSYANTFLPDVLLPLFLCATNIVISRYFHFWLKLGLFMLPCHTPPVAFLLFLSFFVRLGFSFFFCSRYSPFCTGEWRPGGDWPLSRIQLITNVPRDFQSQSTWAALIPKAVTPGRKDELSGAPGAAPAACGAGPSVPLWGCSLSSLQRDLDTLWRHLEAPQVPKGSSFCFTAAAGEGRTRVWMRHCPDTC